MLTATPKKLALILAAPTMASAWIVPSLPSSSKTTVSARYGTTTPTTTKLDMAAVGIFFGTSTGNTEEAADLIYAAFGSDLAAEPVDVDTLEEGQVAEAFAEHDALVVGTPTWNTGADTERSGTGWDELYYADSKLPALRSVLEGKNVAVFGLGDQESYAENYADATGELFDVFEGLGCNMLGAWSQEGYEHEDSKSIRGDKFCGLLLDAVNQEELSEGRVEQWVAQLKEEGLLTGGSESVGTVNAAVAVADIPDTPILATETTVVKTDEAASKVEVPEMLQESSALLDENIGAHSSGGYTPHVNSVSGRTMWTSVDGRRSYVTAAGATLASSKIGLQP